MEPEVIAALVGGGLLILTKVVEIVGNRRAHTVILRETEILAALPKDSASRAALLRSIDARIGSLTNDRGLTRYPLGVVLALGFGALAVWLGYLAVQYANGWSIVLWMVAAVSAIFGISGVAIYLPKRRRGLNGAVLKDEKGGQPS